MAQEGENKHRVKDNRRYTVFDRDMVEASLQHDEVLFSMAAPVFEGNNGFITGKIVKVDVFMIEIQTDDEESYWLNKAAMVSASVQK